MYLDMSPLSRAARMADSLSIPILCKKPCNPWEIIPRMAVVVKDSRPHEKPYRVRIAPCGHFCRHELRQRCDLQMRDVPFFLQDLDQYEGRYLDHQLPLPIRLA